MVALLAMFFMVQPPAAQSMTVNINDGGTTITSPSHANLVKTPLSTKTDPILIKNTVHLAWLSGEFKWSSKSEWECFNSIIEHESGWDPWSDNGAGWEETGGIPQAHPSNKMAEAGKDYRTNVWTQILWMNSYISSQYGDPCNAWNMWQQRASSDKYGWY